MYSSNARDTLILTEEESSVIIAMQTVQSESLDWSGSKFQTVGPATANARQTSVLR